MIFSVFLKFVYRIYFVFMRYLIEVFFDFFFKMFGVLEIKGVRKEKNLEVKIV